MTADMRDELEKKIDELQDSRKQIYIINNKIARINFTRKHYLTWMECSKTEPSLTFLEYLDGLKASYQEEIRMIRESAK